MDPLSFVVAMLGLGTAIWSTRLLHEQRRTAYQHQIYVLQSEAYNDLLATAFLLALELPPLIGKHTPNEIDALLDRPLTNYQLAQQRALAYGPDSLYDSLSWFDELVTDITTQRGDPPDNSHLPEHIRNDPFLQPEAMTEDSRTFYELELYKAYGAIVETVRTELRLLPLSEATAKLLSSPRTSLTANKR